MRRIVVVVSFSLVVLCAGANGEERKLPRFEPLLAESLGVASPSPRTVTPPGSYALSIDGDFDLGGFVFKDGFPFLHNDGGPTNGNTALGIEALISTEISYFSGTANTAIGRSALKNLTGGFWNTAVGVNAMRESESAGNSVAVGAFALYSSTSGGSSTVAIGTTSLAFTNGSGNTALGAYSLGFLGAYPGVDGSYNTAIGRNAGRNLGNTLAPATDLSNNIFIGNEGPADVADSVFIGENGTHTTTFVAGIHNAVLSDSNEHQVCVDDADQLGLCSPSSARFKSQIESMGGLSAALLDLRPVVFNYRPEVKKEAESLQFGLVAEEVAEVFPHLVRYDDDGKPLTLRYDLLTPLLLNELQKQHRQNRVQWFLIAGIMLGGVVVATRWRLG